LLNLKEYRTNPLEMVMITHGGLVFYGGAIFAFLAALVYMKKAVLPLLDTLDLLVPFVALGHAIGRIGCFLNGCCFGRPACGFFGAVFQDGIPRIPTQLYSSLLLLCLFLYLKARLERRKFRGQVAYSYLMLYPAGRIFMELLRGDNAVAVSVLGMGLSFSQLVSLLLLLIGISGYMAERRKWIRTKSL
jgi:phosphatidylglycerol:prolipoprotein diacylglycerol transferase